MAIKVTLITQARLGSKRLPKKILKEIKGKSLLEIHIERLKKCTKVSEIIIATTTNKADELIFKKALDWNVSCFKGSENDVLDRFFLSVKDRNPDYIVRVTSDCPLIDPKLIDEIIEYAIIKNVDYCSNNLVEHFPDGQDVEVIKFSALKNAWKYAKLNSEREHVTPYIRNNSSFNGIPKFSSVNFKCKNDFSNVRMTVDEQNDFDMIKQLIKSLGINKSWLEYTEHILKHDLNKINNNFRNEGYYNSLNQD
jgi:spore coat polysaccharide biosynthesis protein SpsF (cytidylyltransferase family)